MKKKETSDKSLLCVVGIFVCLVFIILPPVLRKAMPKQEQIVIENDYSSLNCHTADNSEVIVVNYKGKDYGIGQMKYTYTMKSTEENEEGTTTTPEYKAALLKSDMERSYNLEKIENREKNTMTYILSPLKSSETNTIDPNDLLLLSIELKQIPPENQKQYYEKLGFECSISDL